VGDLFSIFGHVAPVVAVAIFFFIGFSLARWWTVLTVPVMAGVLMLGALAQDQNCNFTQGECNGPQILLYLFIVLGLPAMLATALGVGLRRLVTRRVSRIPPG
jgi:uncharacterized membrane protein YhaH (DUF805 family)